MTPHHDRRTPTTKPEQELALYLELLAQAGMSRHPDFARLRVEGRFYTPQTLPRAYHFGRRKDCYRDATYLALYDDPTLTYAEGYANSGLICAQHAWCVDADGRVIDRVWRTNPRGRKYSHEPSQLAYFGIAFTAAEIRETIIRTRYFGMLFTRPLREEAS